MISDHNIIHGSTLRYSDSTGDHERFRYDGGFRNEKSNTATKNQPAGGGVGSELDPGSVAWAGSVKHVLVENLLFLSP